LATTVLLGCPQAPQEEMEGPKAESILPPEPEAQEANACPEGAVALVGEHPITLEDAEKRAKMNLKHEGIEESDPDYQANLKIARKGAVDFLIEAYVLQQAATTTVPVATAEVEAELLAIKSRHPNRESYEEGLRRTGMTEEQFRDLLRRELQIRRVIATEASRGVPTPSPEEARQFYDINTMIFAWPYRVQFDEIIWPFPAGVSDASKEQALARMQEYSDQFRADPKSFDALLESATRAVWGPVGSRGGYSNVEELPDPVKEALKTLNVGEPSLPIMTDYGVTILTVRSTKQSYESAYREILQSLFDERVRQNMEEWKERQKTKHRIQICPDMLDYYEGTGEWAPETEQQP
jgi:parvulin-like peptidyl-prolyl isomerase